VNCITFLQVPNLAENILSGKVDVTFRNFNITCDRQFSSGLETSHLTEMASRIV
jgi:hypothetical protein